MISSISLRLPRKMSGLFDIGFAGGLDATSLDVNAQAVVSQELPFHGMNDIIGTYTGIPQSSVENFKTVEQDLLDTDIVDWGNDLLDPMDNLGDPLADSSLDAFINLEDFLNQSPFMDGGDAFNLNDGVEVKPVIEMPTLNTQELLFENSTLNSDWMPVEPVQLSEQIPVVRKRKAGSSVSKGLKTSLFTISTVDHDYTSKHPKMSPSVDTTKKPIKSANGDGNSKGKSSKVSFEANSGVESTDKQVVRRIKNNVASKRSREQRKQKFVEMDHEAEWLITENDRLRNKIVELEALAKEMKAALIAKMAGKA